MLRYRNEAAFSKALCASFTKRGIFHQRIESGETGRGIPDMFAVLPSIGPCWIELKRVHCNASAGATVRVPWRPGQLGWMMKEMRANGVPCFTLACFNNVILRIPIKRYTENLVTLDASMVFYRSVSDVR